MGQVDREMVEGLYGWIKDHTDLLDWGYKHPKGVSRTNTTAQLDRGWQPGGYPTTMPKKAVRRHLENTGETFYYTCSRLSEIHPLMLDIDAHHGEPDARELCDYAVALFPGIYREASTNARGFHGYAPIRVGRTPRRLFRGLMNVLAKALAAIAKAENFKAKIELKGVCSLLVPDKSRIERRGTLAKVPRLARGDEDLQHLLASPVFDLRHVLGVVMMAPRETKLVEMWCACLLERYESPENIPDFLCDPRICHPLREIASLGAVDEWIIPSVDGVMPLDDDLSAKPARRRGDKKRRTSYNGSISDRLMQARTEPDALVRMRLAGQELARMVDRVPSQDELLQFYVARGLNTGEARGNERRHRAESVLKFVAKTFQPHEGKGFSWRRDEIMAIIRQQVKPDDRQGTCYKYRITDEDLAVALYLVEKGSFRGHFECTIKSIQNMFVILKEAGHLKRSCNGNKAVAMKTILVRAELIVCSDETYRYNAGSAGYGKEYTIGPKHPRYGEFISLKSNPPEAHGVTTA